MGYRSTIIIGVEREHAPILDKIFKEYEMTPDESLAKSYPSYIMVKDSYGNYVDHIEGDALQMVIYKFEYLKWYDEYPDVIAVTKCLEELHEEHEETTFLIGLGEMGETHSEIGEWHNFVDYISKLEIQD